jgi:alkylation response protein AidB-like acyl-CoA dehydrogenase
MDINLEDHQLELATVAREFFERRSPTTEVRRLEGTEPGWSAETWREMAALDWLGLGHSDDVGGAGGGTLDLTVIYDAMGRTLAAVPHLESSVIGAGALVAAGTPLARDVLPSVLDGSVIVTPALAEADAGFGPDAIAMAGKLDAGGGLRLDGAKVLVAYAGSAGHVLVAARTAEQSAGASGITVALVPTDAPGLSRTLLPNLAGYPLYEVAFDGVTVGADAVLGEPGRGWELLVPTLERATVLRSAQIHGAAERLLEISVDYATTRSQFGKPIGQYQAVQYLCSDIAINTHLTSLHVRYAAGLLDEGLDATKAVSEAKAQANHTAVLAPERAHAVHAGLAFMLEYDVQLFTRRCRHWELDLGDERYHRERIAAALVAATAA